MQRGAISAFFYVYDTIPLKNDTYPIFYKNEKYFFLFSVFGAFKVEMWNISIKSMVSEHWICHKCVMEVEYITTCGIFLLKFGYLK